MSGIIWMVLTLALHVWPGVVKPAHGQGSRKDDIVFNTRGVPLSGASVRVCAMPATGQPCTPLALIYSDPLLTQALANPTTTDGMGNYFFYAAPGQYEIEISGPTITTKQIPNVILPSDPSSPTFSSITSTGGINAFTLSLTGNLTVNGSTSVVGNLASATMTLTNQATPPGTPGAGTVNLYTKTVDKRLYYKDETGTEVGPIATSSGAQTNQVNNWTAVQNFDADVHPKGPNPWYDITQFGGYIGTNYSAAATTCSISASSTAASCASASDFANGHGILILGAGPATAIATPQAPTVTPYFQVGTTTRNYCVADRDWAGGITPCGPVGSTTTAPASMGMASYTITGWSFNATNHTETVTISAGHNMPTTASGISSEPYAQIEVQANTTNNRACEGAFSLTAVPSSTTFQFTRNELTADPGCSGGTMRIQPRILLTWDSHYTYSVQSATCSGGTATVTVSPGVYGPANTAASNWIVPWLVKAVFSGISDSHYNGTFQIAQYAPGGSAPNSVQFNLGSCSGVTNVGAGGTMGLVPGKAVKNHLIYACTGGSCALPANAANYSLVGVAIGNDGYFQDNGWGANAPTVDTGDAPATAPTTATNEYLDTTIISGGGTTSLTLANAAASSVTNSKAFHDNTPNLLAACAALPQGTTGTNGGRIVIPTPGSTYNFFPIVGNFDMYGTFGTNSATNCPGRVTLEFHAPPFLLGTILLAKGANIMGGPGSTNCATGFYGAATEMTCIQGYAYPMVYFEPETSSLNLLQNVLFNPNQSYQSGLYFDAQLNGDGNVGERFENVHVNGGNTSYPVVDKGGFGRFWNYGGWSASNGSAPFSQARDYVITFNCGMPTYLSATPSLMYIFTTNQTYSFGTFEVDTCGQSNLNFGTNVTFNQVLTENAAGPMFKINTYPRGLAGITFSQMQDADNTGGGATPYIDVVNATVTGAIFDHNLCANGVQPFLQTGASQTQYFGILYQQSPGICPAGLGLSNAAGASTYEHNDMGNAKVIRANEVNGLLGSAYIGTSEIPAPTAAPTVAVVTTCANPIAAGSYSYAVSWADGSAQPGTSEFNRTKIGPASSSVTVNGTTQCVQITPPTAPPGAIYFDTYRVNAPVNAGQRIQPNFTSNLYPVGTTVLDESNGSQNVGSPGVNGAYAHVLNQTGFFGSVSANNVANATGLQVFNTATSCTTAATAGATCTTAAISLPVAEADTSYRVVCTGKGPTNVPVVVSTANSSATQFTITIAALTAAAATFASFDCTVAHN